MKFRIKLLKDWTAPDGTEHLKGVILEFDAEDKELVGTLLLDETAVKATEKDVQPKALDMDAIKLVVKEVIEDSQKAFVKDLEEKGAIITGVHDNENDDPTGGYLGYKKEYSKRELEYGLALFVKDCYAADMPGGKVSEKMLKFKQKSQELIDKAAGDGLTVEVDSEGGHLVPTSFSTMLNDATLENTVVRSRATMVTIPQGNRIRLPQAENYDHSSDLLFGGIQAFWKGEEAQVTEKKPKFEEIALELNKLTALAFLSEEIMKFSAITMGSLIVPMMSAAVAWKEDDGFINGTGVGMPLGLKNAPGLVTVAIEAGQTINEPVVSENIDNMWSRAMIRRLASTIWIYNKTDLWPSLAGLTRTVGTGGAPAGLVQMLAGSPQMSIYGLPLVDTEHMEASGTVGDIYLTDLSQYLVADDASGAVVSQSIHLKFDFGQLAIKIVKFVDGQPRWSKVFTRQNSTNTMSSIVALAVRT